MDKLIDKHIRRFASNGVVERLLACENGLDATELFEAAHAAKGVCANLGLTGLSEAASEITEEFSPGSERRLSDEQVREKLQAIGRMYATAVEGINRYAAACDNRQ